jgi:hypothetical protein
MLKKLLIKKKMAEFELMLAEVQKELCDIKCELELLKQTEANNDDA